MVILHQITPTLSTSYKTVRLRALKDTPSAFGSTYARESQFSEADWRTRAANLCTPHSIGYLAYHQGEYCGIAAGFLDKEVPQNAELVSMWVASTHRRTGTGKLLVDAIESWARLSAAHTLRLMVTNTNLAAISFYERLGFTATGRTEPYPNDPNLIEYEMSKSIL
ncbi:GNAT family N-acetyltransferase [Tunturiibacter gelidoferens]|uniref:Ribosomal protein S18 acetylase RimI-like enzyme n=1 Tax=Tunturiibacter gelidiferens TaxID=3069689 RepID=A0A9X0U3S6_9BACT|nr:GNAT family N-acetyltransferase [Edaphobacter lichenicola]MBB5328659.1 ribosomal protein S18 acetylase RimI-like enzyme [Edaphobacter lichenicola]